MTDLTPLEQLLSIRATKLWRTIERAQLELDQPGAEPLASCQHPASPVKLMCGLHPAAGLLCPSCWAEHTARHSPDATCGTCGEPCGDDPTDTPVESTWDITAPVWLRTPAADGGVRFTQWPGGTIMAVLARVHRACVPPGQDLEDDPMAGG